MQFYFVLMQYQYIMTQYNTWNVKLFISQLNKLKSGTQNSSEVTWNLSSNVIGDSKEENNVLHKIIVTNKQASKLRQDFSNGSSANIKLSKTELHKMRHLEEFLGRLLGPLLRTWLSLIKILKPLAESVLILLNLTASAAKTNTLIH